MVRKFLTTPSAPLGILRAIFLLAQIPLLWEEGNSSHFTISSLCYNNGLAELRELRIIGIESQTLLDHAPQLSRIVAEKE